MLNGYFPCDPRNDQYDDTEIMNLLTEIRSIIEGGHYSNILLAGDFNCHFERNNSFTNLIGDYLYDLGLQILWSSDEAKIENVDYTFHSSKNGIVSYSVIDHFAVNQALMDKIITAGVVHNGENLSNHEAIFMKIDVGKIDPKLEVIPPTSRPCW